MSRSYLKNKYMRKLMKEKLDRFNENENNQETKNIHKYDEMPKNRASRRVTENCSNYRWLQEPVNYGGHKVKSEGHRMVSGIIRAKEKEKIRNIIDENNYEDNN